MQKVRSDYISPTLNAWQVECWTIDRDLCEVMGDLANDPTCLELQKWICWIFWNNKMLQCQGDTLYGLSRLELRFVCAWRAVFWICMRLESARGKFEVRKGLERCFFEPVWHIMYIYIVHFHGVHLFDYSQWFCLWRAKPLGYPADDVDCLLAGQMATAEAPCHCQKIHRQCRQCDCITVPNAHVSSVTWIYLLPRWFERWI